MTWHIPASTNQDYHGPIFAAWALGLYGGLRIITGGIHVFLEDGGAGRIAGIPLTAAADIIISLFAWAGSTQIAWGLLLLALAWHYRSLVPLALAAAFLEQFLIAMNVWVLKPGAAGQPPGAYGALVFSAVLGLCCVLSWCRRS